MLDVTHLLTIDPHIFSAIDVHWSFTLNWDIFNHLDISFFAQEFKQDVMGDIRRGFQNFVQSGQLVALIVGLVLGYLFRSVTVG
ncbi:MAG: hypothetical protein ACK4QL_09930 [Pseudanabaenaceae cyanobacterium]